MEVYESDDKFVLAVKGGQFKEFESNPQAIILNSAPVPTMKWITPEEIDINVFKGTASRHVYEFREFYCDGKLIYILTIYYTSEKPYQASGKTVFFLDEHIAKEKISDLRNRGAIAEYKWDASVPTWIEIERGFKFEDEDEDEEEV